MGVCEKLFLPYTSCFFVGYLSRHPLCCCSPFCLGTVGCALSVDAGRGGGSR